MADNASKEKSQKTEADKDAQATDSSTKKRGRGHVVLIVLALVVALLAVGYVGGLIYFGSHTMPNTTVNGEDASNLSTEELAARFEGDTSDYSITVSGEGLNLTIAASDIDYEVDGAAMASEVVAQLDPLTWPVGITETHEVEVELEPTYDETKLTNLVTESIETLNAATTAEAQATPAVAYNSESQRFELSDTGTAYLINVESVVNKVTAAIDAQETSVAIDANDLDETSPVVDGLDTANSWLAAADTHLYLGDTDVYTLTADQIAGWISFDEEGNPSLNTDAILEWAKGDLSDQLDTVGIARSYTRPDGKQVSVEGGAYGWSINGDQIATDLDSRITSGDNSDYTIPCYQEADIVNYGGMDWTGNWFDCDLTEQHVRLYDPDGNILWEADVVTGNADGTHNTPEGTYYITSKETNARLVGPEVGGVTEWDSVVAYWFGVVGQRIGLHSAQWRSSFGGNIYTYNGSHGCINISEAKAAEVYDLIEVGMPFVIHS